MKKAYLLAALSVALSCAPKTSVLSPDGRTRVLFSIQEGVPFWAVEVDGRKVVDPSPVGLAAFGASLEEGYTLVGSKLSRHDETWSQPWGENKQIRDRHNALTLKLKNASGVAMCLEFRAFDDGIAFRSSYDAPGDSLLVSDELTEFRFSEDALSWSIPGDFNSYEHLYRKMPLSALRDANTPLTIRREDGLHLSVHEAALMDFPEMVLRKKEGTAFKADLAPRHYGDSVKAIVPSSFRTPWRTLQISPDAVGLVNSSVILNLNEPCALEDVSWIKPMKYIGVWWAMHLGIASWGGDRWHGATTQEAIRYIDFAAQNNIQGVLFEGWNDAWKGSDALPDFDFTSPAPDFDVEAVVEYAREKGVCFITHNETGGNVARFEQQLERSLDWAEGLGIHALKTGYAGGGLRGGVPRHSQQGVQHFQRVAQAAAAHKVMIDGHEVIKPTGIRRTWPNFMTRECVRGMEYNGWSTGNPPSHHEILPYTRALGGPVDYTPGVFDVQYRNIQGLEQVRSWGRPGTECRVNTTLCKQIANWVVLYSPLQMACDLISNYEGHPAFQFFRDFDPDCDESRALSGEVGEYIAVVRRAADKYFYGATTDDSARDIVQSLDFLRRGTVYEAVIYADAPDASWQDNPYAYQIIHCTVTCEDTLPVHLAPGGGQAIVFSPQ